MPIVDYALKAQKDEVWFFNLDSISDKNKDIVKRFLKSFNVSPATKSKFLRHIKFLLERIDLQEDMLNRDKINSVFSEMKMDISPGYFNTIVNVSKRLAIWLNDDELPKGFKDTKKLVKKDEMRNLKPSDMWSWEDGKDMIKEMNSTQMKAMVMTQLDAGFRPSEFIDLNYGDVIVKKDIVIFQVREGKTGARAVPCHRCVPYFLRWYSQHPTKKANDPLWIGEFNDKSHPKDLPSRRSEVRRYKYGAILKRFEAYAERAGKKKPCDFYNFRHSSCALDKIENLSLEVAAKRHGHSVEYFTKVYGRLDFDDLANIMRTHYGGAVEKRKLDKTIVCERCDTANESTAEFCSKCTAPLSLRVALEIEKTKTDEIGQLKKRMDEIQEALAMQVVKKEKYKA